MNENEQLQLFEDQAIRTAWDEENEEWYFSIVDVVSVLTDAKDYDTARNYWKVTKKRLKDEGSQLVTDCNQLKLKSPKDGKRYKTDVANTQQLFRIIQGGTDEIVACAGWAGAHRGNAGPGTHCGTLGFYL